MGIINHGYGAFVQEGLERERGAGRVEEGRTGAEGEKKGGKEGERKVTSGFLSRRTVIFGAAVPGESADAEQWQSPKKELSWQGAPSPV